jgi:pimeloyl-ACP methyl ester carboxylesterase
MTALPSRPIASATADLAAIRMHYLQAGQGDPVLLVHGWPQSSHEWRQVMPLLAPHYTVVAPDLRGLGDSTRASNQIADFDSATLADDLWQLTRSLGWQRFHLVGHDWGGPTAFALARAHPDAVRTLSIIDVTIPGLGPDISQGGKRWHHAFHMTPDLPEALTAGRERDYIAWFLREYCWRREAITEADIDHYAQRYAQPGAMQSGFNLYRNIPRNAAANQAFHAGGGRLTMPVLALGGARAEARGRVLEPAESLKVVCDNLNAGTIADAGHLVPEEQPELLAAQLLAHFQRG